MKKLLILGAGVYQVPLIRTARRMGLYTIVTSIPGDYPGFRYADKAYHVNTIDREAVLEIAKEERIDGICTSGTDVAITTISYVCSRMGLSGVPEHAALCATNKAKMKKAFRDGGVRAARFTVVRSPEETLAAAEKTGFPVMVKRVDSSGSRGITLVKEKSGIAEAFAEALRASRADYALVEDVLHGVEIGVDGVVHGGKLVFLAPHEKFVYRSDRITIPVGHGFPYRGLETVQREIRAQMERAVNALGLDECSVNADVFVDGEQVSLIEIGARTGATCIPELISMYYGFDFYEKIIQNALGMEVSFAPGHEPRPCMAKLLMSPVDGRITSVDEEALDRIRQGGAEIKLDYPVGHAVERMINGTTRIGHVIAAADKVETLDEIMADVYRCIRVNGETLEELWRK